MEKEFASVLKAVELCQKIMFNEVEEAIENDELVISEVTQQLLDMCQNILQDLHDSLDEDLDEAVYSELEVELVVPDAFLPANDTH